MCSSICIQYMELQTTKKELRNLDIGKPKYWFYVVRTVCLSLATRLMNANLFARNDHKLENQNKIFDFNKTKQQN